MFGWPSRHCGGSSCRFRQAEIAWVAEDGRGGRRACLHDTPDLILMDMIMPVMDGVEATRLIMRQCPCPILVVTATVTGNAGRVYEALGHGALDAVNTPVLGANSDLAGGARPGPQDPHGGTAYRCDCVATNAAPQAAPIAPPNRLRQGLPMVAIGASTGGPQALVQVLFGLPLERPFAVVIVQHVDALFAPGLAQWLSSETRRPVTVIESGQRLEEGAIGVAATNDHLILDRHGRLRYVREPVDHVHRPSVDVFFHSLLTAPVPTGRGSSADWHGTRWCNWAQGTPRGRVADHRARRGDERDLGNAGGRRAA